MKDFVMDVSRVENMESFHDVSSEVFDFPHYYGRNMDAWIDCMSDLAVDPLRIRLVGGEHFKKAHADLFQNFSECVDFVNTRLLENEGGVALKKPISYTLE